jgi:hypothetical protein
MLGAHEPAPDVARRSRATRDARKRRRLLCSSSAMRAGRSVRSSVPCSGVQHSGAGATQVRSPPFPGESEVIFMRRCARSTMEHEHRAGTQRRLRPGSPPSAAFAPRVAGRKGMQAPGDSSSGAGSLHCFRGGGRIVGGSACSTSSLPPIARRSSRERERRSRRDWLQSRPRTRVLISRS